MKRLAPLALLVAVATASLAEDKGAAAPLPINVFADACVGDWVTVLQRQTSPGSEVRDGPPILVTWTVSRIESGQVTVAMKRSDSANALAMGEVARAQPPTIDRFARLNGAFLDETLSEVSVEDARYPLAGTELDCKKVSWVQTLGTVQIRHVYWLAPRVRALGIVASRTQPLGAAAVPEVQGEVVGWGRAGTTEWGKTADEVGKR